MKQVHSLLYKKEKRNLFLERGAARGRAAPINNLIILAMFKWTTYREERNMDILWLILSAQIGSFFGVFYMCLLTVGKDRKEAKTRVSRLEFGCFKEIERTGEI